MGILDRIGQTIRSAANAAIDKAADPERQVAMLITAVEDGIKTCTAELISYKANEKLLGHKRQELAARAREWEQRAMDAVRAGDDDLAKEALKEHAMAKHDLAEVIAEHNEQAKIAAEMLRARRQLTQQLESLKLRQGTVAANLAQARSGGKGVLSTQSDAFERFEKAENRIEDEAALKELDEIEAGLGEGQTALAEQRIREQTKKLQAEALLSELKAKMEQQKADKDKKK